MRQLFQNNSIFRNAIIILLFFIMVLALYFPVLKADPLWDDWFFLFKSRTVLEGSFLKYWTWGEHRRAWPAFYTVITMMYKFFGTDYFLYRMTNVAIHVINGCLIYKVLRMLKGNYAFLLTCLYLVHPLNFFTVSWIIQIKTLLSIFFFLTSLILFIKNESEFSIKRYVGSVVLFALSLFSKSVFAPVMLLAFFYNKKVRILPYVLICFYTAGLTLWSTHLKPIIKTTDILSPFIETAVSSDNLIRKTRPMAELKAKAPKYTFEDVAVSFKNFARYSAFVIYPSENYLVQQKTTFQYSTKDYFILLITIFGSLLLIKKIVDQKKPFQLMGALFFIVTIFPLCGFFQVPIFHYSNFVDYWLSVPALGIVLLISQTDFKKVTYVVLGIFLIFFTVKTSMIASENTNPVDTITASSNHVPDNALVKLILAKHYFYQEIFSKSNTILINVRKNFTIESEMIDRDIENNVKAMNGDDIDTSSL